MTKIIEATGAGISRIFARFGRTGRKPVPQGSRWYDCEFSSRGL